MEKNINKWWRILFTKREQWIVLMFLFALVILYGTHLNFQVVISNQGKMPVNSGFDWVNGNHRFYEDITEANFWIFGDIIGIKGRFKFSIGDLLIFGGMIGIFYSYRKWRKLRFKHGKREKIFRRGD